jgi:4-pyridoxate dehydrogenase
VTPDELRAHGIAVKVPLKGVGQNLQDHVCASMTYSRKEPGPFQKNLRLDRVGIALAKAYLRGTDFATDLPSGLFGFLKTAPELPYPDFQMLFHAGAAHGETLPTAVQRAHSRMDSRVWWSCCGRRAAVT